jgi:hypothetical protein
LASNPTVIVSTGASEVRTMVETTADESMPPDKNAPSGTSLIRRSCTAS